MLTYRSIFAESIDVYVCEFVTKLLSVRSGNQKQSGHHTINAAVAKLVTLLQCLALLLVLNNLNPVGIGVVLMRYDILRQNKRSKAAAAAAAAAYLAQAVSRCMFCSESM